MYIYAYVYIHTHIHICIYMCIFKYIYINHICIYAHIYYIGHAAVELEGKLYVLGGTSAMDLYAAGPRFVYSTTVYSTTHPSITNSRASALDVHSADS